MTLSVVRLRTSDEAAAVTHAAHLYEEILPGQPGWSGTIDGRAADGSIVSILVWASEQARQALVNRPEYQRWFGEFVTCLDGQPEVQRFPRSEVFLGAIPAGTGFVQLVRGRLTDADRAAELMRRYLPTLRGYRPEIQAILLGTAEDGSFVEVVAFTDEAAARAGESQSPPPEAADLERAFAEVGTIESFEDLRDPVVHLPG